MQLAPSVEPGQLDRVAAHHAAERNRTVIRVPSVLLAFLSATLACGSAAIAQVRVGEIVETSIGSPDPYPNGSAAAPEVVWQYMLHHAGAHFLKLRFARFDVAGSVDAAVPSGDHVVVRSPDGVEREILSGTRHGEFWSRSVPGDTAIIEIYADAVGSAAGIHIDAYGYGHPPARSRSVCGSDDSTGICDAAEPQRAALADAVGRVLFASDCGGMFVCTGFLFSADALFMTNAHCANSARESRSMEVWLNYTQPLEEPREPDCSLAERPNPDVYRASKRVLSDCTLDVAVHQMDVAEKGNPAALYGFLPLSARVPAAGESVWVPQHPLGRPKRIAETGAIAGAPTFGIDFCSDQPLCGDGAGVPTGQLSEIAHTADTGPGSSGSPVVDAHGQVVGLHHAGGCSAGGGANAAVLMARIVPLLGEMPRARLVSEPRRPRGPAPLAVSFDGSGSFDPDGGAIVTYELDPGDGSPVISSSSPILLHTYAAAGTFTAQLRVVDDEGSRARRPSTRRVRARPPR